MALACNAAELYRSQQNGLKLYANVVLHVVCTLPCRPYTMATNDPLRFSVLAKLGQETDHFGKLAISEQLHAYSDQFYDAQYT